MAKLRIISIFIAVALSMSQLASAQSKTIALDWRTIDSFRTQDRSTLKAELGQLWGCGKIAIDEPGADLISHTCSQARAAALSIGAGATLLVIMIPSTGNCGDFQFAVLGPASVSGRRTLVGGKNLNPACGEEVRFEPSPNASVHPALIFVAVDRVSPTAEESSVDERWVWNGDDLAFIKVLKRY